MLVEVLSPSTRKHDLETKRELYLGLPSLQQYLAVASDERRVHLWTRGEGGLVYLEAVDGSINVLGEWIPVEELYPQEDEPVPA